MKISVVFGTRPEAIKLAPVIRELKNTEGFDVNLISTGQHREMMDSILRFFEISPDLDLDLMRPGQNLNDLLVRALDGLKASFVANRPDMVLLQGDTLTSMAASVAAFLEKIPVGHVEAGLRTGDLYSPWPEEFNRRVTALTAQLHFAPTEYNKLALKKEFIDEKQIFVVGNTVTDAIQYVTQKMANNSNGKVNNSFDNYSNNLPALDPKKKKILVTVHRRENFGAPIRQIFLAILEILQDQNIQVVLPLHKNPEVQKAFKETIGAKSIKNLFVTEPLDYVPFIEMMSKSDLIISDSGGVQEEAPFLGKPALILRESTERMESVDSGNSLLVGHEKERIVNETRNLLNNEEAYKKMARVSYLYGDGTSAKKIVMVILKNR